MGPWDFLPVVVFFAALTTWETREPGRTLPGSLRFLWFLVVGLVVGYGAYGGAYLMRPLSN
jgi:hypothetical protein